MSKLLSIKVIMPVVIAVFVTVSTNNTMAQQSLNFQERHPDFHEAYALFQKEKFYAAQAYFEKVIDEVRDDHSELKIEAEYYRAICAIQLFHENAAVLLKNFIESHPESIHINSAYFQLANYKFRKKDYEEVIYFLAEVEPLDLTSKERAEFYFKKGYSHFQLEEFDLAANSLFEIKDTDNPYSSAARYYYAHIAYQDGKYQTAYENFKRIENDPQFGPLVPYYITQLFYLQKKYTELLAYAPAVLDSASAKRETEIRKLIGDSYYETQQFDQAIPYLEDYLKKKSGSFEDYYEIGRSYFEVGKYTLAVSNFEKSIGSNDTLDQSAYYYIGESNVKSNNKERARGAFRQAYKLGVDEELTEDALFNYAKLAYELSYHPYDDAIMAFEEYINTYPKSNKINNAYEYLLGVYYTTKNYEEALKSLNRIKSKDIEILQARQRVAFYRAIELFKEEKYLESVEKFEISLNHNYDPKLKAGSQFWVAEAFYRLGDYDNAANYFSDFLSSSGSRSLDYYEKAYYHLGYVYYEKRNYKSAIFWLKEYVDKGKSANKGLRNDAFLRIGDSYFIQKSYAKAIEAYDNAAEIGVKDKDYALLQSAISSGVLGKHEVKAKKLKALVNEVQQSVYTDDALFELAKTYLLLSKPDDALAYLNQLINTFPNSSYLPEAYLKIGLIHYNKKEDDLALNAFDQVIKSYGNSSSAKAALEKVRKIFIEKGDAQAFEDYINGVPFANISKAKLDSTAYVIAENQYLSGNCEKATRDFTNYLSRYPNGIFSVNAHFYRANCEASSGFDQEALSDFKFVLKRSPNKFTEKSLAESARIYRSMNLLDSAAVAYEMLINTAERTANRKEAQRALMDIYFKQEKYDEAVKYADILLNGEMLPASLWQQAQMIKVKTNFQKENYDLAKVFLDSLFPLTNEVGAEAKYLLAKIYYLEGEYKESDSVIYQLVDQVPSYPYWIAKGFILLADNFIAKEDLYNARITFQSVIDNADDEELISIAKEKLKILTESQESKDEDEKEIEVELGIESVSDPAIFENDSIEVKVQEEVLDED